MENFTKTDLIYNEKEGEVASQYVAQFLCWYSI